MINNRYIEKIGFIASAHCPAAHRAEEAVLQSLRSADIRLALLLVSRPSRCPGGRQTRDRHSLAPRWVQNLLALEIKTRRGRPRVPLEIRQLIREMSLANPLWGAPRIHGELLKLGLAIGQTSVAKYMLGIATGANSFRLSTRWMGPSRHIIRVTLSDISFVRVTVRIAPHSCCCGHACPL